VANDFLESVVIPNPGFIGVRDLLMLRFRQAAADPSSGRALVRDDMLSESRIKNPHTLRVATAGGTAAARLAGPNTAICPSTHSATAPIGR
jgi:hypothetical protein